MQVDYGTVVRQSPQKDAAEYISSKLLNPEIQTFKTTRESFLRSYDAGEVHNKNVQFRLRKPKRLIFSSLDEQFGYMSLQHSGEQKYAASYVNNFYRYLSHLVDLNGKFLINSQLLMKFPQTGHNFKGLVLGKQGSNAKVLQEFLCARQLRVVADGLLVQFNQNGSLVQYQQKVKESILIFLDIITAAQAPENKNFYKQLLLFGKRVKYEEFLDFQDQKTFNDVLEEKGEGNQEQNDKEKVPSGVPAENSGAKKSPKTKEKEEINDESSDILPPGMF